MKTLLQRFRWPFRLLATVVVLFGTSLVTASELEEHDEFCTSCHRAPEVTYFDRTHTAVTNTTATDLASFHYVDNNEFRCIDCHRGDQSLSQRAQILWLAAQDTAVHFLGNPDQTIEKGNASAPTPHADLWQGPERFTRTANILNDGCLSCHQDALTLVGFENHFHNKLPQAQLAYAQTERLNFPKGWPGAAGSPALLVPEETVLTCLDCHRAHVPGLAFEYFLDETAVVLPACVQCHLEAEAGPVDLAGK